MNRVSLLWPMQSGFSHAALWLIWCLYDFKNSHNILLTPVHAHYVATPLYDCLSFVALTYIHPVLIPSPMYLINNLANANMSIVTVQNWVRPKLCLIDLRWAKHEIRQNALFFCANFGEIRFYCNGFVLLNCLKLEIFRFANELKWKLY